MYSRQAALVPLEPDQRILTGFEQPAEVQLDQHILAQRVLYPKRAIRQDLKLEFMIVPGEPQTLLAQLPGPARQPAPECPPSLPVPWTVIGVDPRRDDETHADRVRCSHNVIQSRLEHSQREVAAARGQTVLIEERAYHRGITALIVIWLDVAIPTVLEIGELLGQRGHPASGPELDREHVVGQHGCSSIHFTMRIRGGPRTFLVDRTRRRRRRRIGSLPRP